MTQAGNVNSTNTNTINTANVLIAANDPELGRFILKILAQKGIRGHFSDNRKNAIDLLNKDFCDLVIISDMTDNSVKIPDRWKETFRIIEQIHLQWPELPLVMVTDSLNLESEYIVEHAVNAIRKGCYDFLLKPLDRSKVENLLDTFLPNHNYSVLDVAEQGPRRYNQIVGRSAKLNRAVSLAKKIAPTSVPVLISGESGTGKELIGHLIHQNSKRAHGSYIRVNCAALSETLLESELFGHEKGAFTGAFAQRKGRFEMAHNGTLLLDEIAETPISFQAKLLRVLEQQDFERVGGNDRIRVDVRIVSTTNRDLLHEVRQGQFRQDLYYRLSGVKISLCPLRERTDDLADLIWNFVNLYSREVPRRITSLDPAMVDIFKKYHWPGNIRQLRNVIRTSLILGSGNILSLADVSWLLDEFQPLPQQKLNNQNSTCEFRSIQTEESVQDNISDESQNDYSLAGLPLEQVERRAIMETLQQAGGNKTKAAKVLGISDRTLRERIQRYRKEGCPQPV